MDGQTVVNPAGAAEAPTGGSGAASPTAQPGAGAPTPASPSGSQPGASAQPQPRTYSTEEMSRAVQSRLAEERTRWEKQFGSPAELQERRAKLDRYEAAFKGEQAPKVSQEEKELRDLLDKQGYVRKDAVDGVAARLNAIEQANQQAHAKAGRSEISRLATEKLGTSDPNVLRMLENVISASIAGDKESLDAWNSGDTSVIAKHFESSLSQSFDPLFKSASARYTSGKAKDKAEVPPAMPKGGVQAPLSTERKMTSEERKEAAYKRLQELEGQA